MQFKVQSPDGRIITLEGETAPTEQELDEIFASIPKKQEEPTETEQSLSPQEVDERVKALNEQAGRGSSSLDVAKAGLEGFGKGVATGLERVASGLTLGGYDWASDKLGLGSKERLKEIESLGTPLKVATKGTQLVGSLVPTSKLIKAVGLPLSGVIEGGVSSGFDTDFNVGETVKGALIGGALSTALAGAGKLAKSTFGKRTAIKGVQRGLENAVQSDKGTKVLDKAVKVDSDIARKVIDKAPEAMENINRSAINTLNKGLGNKTNIAGAIKNARDEFGQFIAENGSVPVAGKTPKSLGLKGLTANQKSALSKAWSVGKRDTLQKAGSLEHLQQTQKNLGDMISVAKRQGENQSARNLTILKKQVDDKISESLLPEMRNKYSQAMRLQDAYQQGIDFNPNKPQTLSFSNQAEKNAFGQGLVDKITANPEARNIAGNVKNVKGAMRTALGKNAEPTLKQLEKLDEAYSRIKGLAGKAYSKTGRQDPSGLFLREQMESKGSLKGTIGDYLLDKATLHKSRGAASYLLDPSKQIKASKYDKLEPALLNILSAGTPSLNRKLQGEE